MTGTPTLGAPEDGGSESHRHPESNEPLSSTSTGLGRTEQKEIQDRFGVSAEQVRRDHLISHLLGSLSNMTNKSDLIFFGGTAFSRTLLLDLRLSEDTDLIKTSSRSAMASSIMDAFESGLARTHGRLEWLPPLDKTRDAKPAVLRVNGPTPVQIQLLSSDPCRTRRTPAIRQRARGPPALRPWRRSAGSRESQPALDGRC